MKLTSPVFEHEGTIPTEYTCVGEDNSPELHISDAPEGVKTFALIVDDPDALKPAGKIWDHWVAWNIPGDTTTIGKNASGFRQGENGSGNNCWMGPCPPDGEHRYYFKLYALDVELDLPEGSTKKQVENAMEGHVLAETVLMGRFTK